MIVQSSDGYFYQNPRFTTTIAIVEFTDDGCFLFRKGNVSWKTAVSVLRPLGIKAKLVFGAVAPGAQKIINGDLISTTQFTIQLTGPIPTPHNHQACIREPVSDNEEIIRFKVKKPRRTVPSDGSP